MKKSILTVAMVLFIAIMYAQKNEIGTYFGLPFQQTYKVDEKTDSYIRNIHPKSTGGVLAGVTFKRIGKTNFMYGAQMLYSKNSVWSNCNTGLRAIAAETFSLPVSVGYVVEKKIYFSTEIGVGPSILARSVVFSDVEGDVGVPDKNKFGIASFVDLSAGYIVNNNIKMFVSVRSNGNASKIGAACFGGGIAYSFINNE